MKKSEKKAKKNKERLKSDSSFNNRNIESINDAIIAEYTVLRGELSLYHSHQKQIMNFVFVLFAAFISILGSDIHANSKSIVNYQIILLTTPFIFLVLAFLYADRTVRIIRIADYIHNHLRKSLIKNLNYDLWNWENYKAETQIFNRKLTLFLDKMRWLVFILPSIVSLVIYLKIVPNPYIDIQTGVMFSVSIMAIFFNLLVMFITEETKGIKSK